MEIVNRFQLRSPFLILLLALLLPGCAHVISKDLRAQADLTLTFQEVAPDPEVYLGKIVLWGGEIIQALNQGDRTTLIEVLERPLNWMEEPKVTDPSEGRFLILVETHLDPSIYRQGRKITVAGEILGEKTRPLGEMEYRYPLLLSRQSYLWTKCFYQYLFHPSNPPYDPWGYYDLAELKRATQGHDLED
jgi:outer membrane lipoprotein